MTTHAYSPLYLSKASRAVGNMLHDAVVEFGMDGEDFLKRFIQSDVAEEIESGNPKYIAGKSGLELFLEVMEKTTGKAYDAKLIESYERSPVYWVGWMLTHYQWYSGRTFKSILDTVPYNELLGLYGTLHEADIEKSYEVLDAHFEKSGVKSVKTTGETRNRFPRFFFDDYFCAPNIKAAAKKAEKIFKNPLKKD